MDASVRQLTQVSAAHNQSQAVHRRRSSDTRIHMLTHALKQPAWWQVMGDRQGNSRFSPFIISNLVFLSSFWFTHHMWCRAAIHAVTWRKGSRDKPRFPGLGVPGEYRETVREREARGTPGGTVFWFLLDSLSLSVQVASRMQIKMKEGEWKELRTEKEPWRERVRTLQKCLWVSMNIYQLCQTPPPHPNTQPHLGTEPNSFECLPLLTAKSAGSFATPKLLQDAL